MSAPGNRILVLPSWYPPDGGYFFKEHCEALARAGWDVHVLVNRVVGARKLKQSGLSALKGFRCRDENGITVCRTRTLKLPGSEELNIRRWTGKTLQAYLRYEAIHGKPALILAHSVTWAGYAAALIREQSRVPYVVVEHRSYFVWSTPEARALARAYHLPYYEKAYRDSHKVVPVAESLLTGLRALMPWIDEKVRVIPNMIREDMFLPPDGGRPGLSPGETSGKTSAESPGTTPFRFFWAGRLEHVKGIDVLLKALKILSDRSSRRFSVRLAGKGSLRAELEQQARELGVAERVTFLGRISREAMQEEMRGASCFVLPTRYEAFGAVLIEAMATGLPVIATRSGGPDSIVTPESGLLVDPDSADQLASAMEQMMAGYASFDQDLIRRQCMERYGEKAVLAEFGDLFREILDQ